MTTPHPPYPDGPYPGLRPFFREDADIFFGRDAQVLDLLEKLQDHRFVAVIGESGSGKSSLVRAGLVPALEEGYLVASGSRWAVAELRPGSTPIDALAAALVANRLAAPALLESELAASLVGAGLRRGRHGLVETLAAAGLPERTNVLVVVDQFEELFRFPRPDVRDEAERFVALLLTAVAQRERPVFVVLSMRSEYLGDCAAFPGLPEAVNRGLYLTPRMSRDQLREAIVAPARLFGGDVDPALANRLLNDAGAEPDQLPLLQHVLMRMWDRAGRETGATDPGAPARRVLREAHYAAVGAFGSALSAHADEALAELTPRLQVVAARVFRGLTERVPGRGDGRRPARIADLARACHATVAEVQAVVEAFRTRARSFLVPPLPASLTPESVVDITHESLIRQWGRLTEWVEDEYRAADTYRLLSATAQRWRRGEAALWRSPDLDAALAWEAREEPTEEWARRYDGGFRDAFEFLAASRAAAERERRRRHRRARALRWTLAALLLVLAGTGLRAGYELLRQLDAAEVTALLRTERSAAALEESERRRRAAEERRADLEKETRRAVRESEAARDAQARIARERDDALRRQLSGALATAARAPGLERSPDQRLVLAAEAVRQWPTDSALSALYAALPVCPRDTSCGGVPQFDLPQFRSVPALAWSPDGSQLLAPGRRTDEARIWYATGNPAGLRRSELRAPHPDGHAQQVSGVAWSPDGHTALTVSKDWRGLFWSPTGQPVKTLSLRGHTGRITAVDWRSWGILTASLDGTARVWTRDDEGWEARIVIRESDAGGRRVGVTGFQAAGWSPDGARVFALSRRGLVYVAATSEVGDPVRRPLAEDRWERAAWNADGSRLLLLGDGRVRVWRVADGFAGRQPQEAGVTAACWDSQRPDRLAVCDGDGTVTVWTATAQRPWGPTLSPHGGAVNDCAFSPDGAWVLTVSEDGTARLSAAADGAARAVLSADRPIVRGLWSGPGRHVLTVTRDGVARVWPVEPHDLLAAARRLAPSAEAAAAADEAAASRPVAARRARRP